MLEKAQQFRCDVVVLDLEDAVAPDDKDLARSLVCSLVKAYGAREVVVRINGLSCKDGRRDLEAVTAARPHAILLPKIASAKEVRAISCPIPLWAMIETPKAVMNLAAIARSGVACLIMGSNDLLKEMGATSLADQRNLWFALGQTVIAARAHGLSVIDGTYNDFADEAGFRQSCERARAFGFDGKSLIHPRQIAICNHVFAPSCEEISQAEKILAAFNLPQNKGKAVIAVDGCMIERLHAEQAERVLAHAQAIAERD